VSSPRSLRVRKVRVLIVVHASWEGRAERVAASLAGSAPRKSMTARAIEVRDRFSMARIGAMWDDLFRSLGGDVDA